MPAWHPNFRDYEKLPDVKVVRTAFFVNGAAVAALLVVATFFGINEYQLRVLNGQLAETQQRIDRDKKPSDQAVALYKRFQAEEAKVKEAAEFVASRPSVSELLLHLAQNLPENIALDAVDVRANGVSLRLSVKGAPEVAAGHATAYLQQLRNDTALAYFDRTKFEFTNQSRNPSTGGLAVEFFLRFTAQYGEKRS